MSEYKVTLNGVEYHLEVEKIGNQGSAVQGLPKAPVARQSSARQSAPARSAAPAKLAEQKSKLPVTVAVGQGEEKITAPMPGNIVNVCVKEGQSVKKGEVLLILEAMKMENEIMAPRNCTVKSVCVSAGNAVDTNELLCVLQ